MTANKTVSTEPSRKKTKKKHCVEVTSGERRTPDGLITRYAIPRHLHSVSWMPITAYVVEQNLFLTISKPFVEIDYTVSWALLIVFKTDQLSGL